MRFGLGSYSYHHAMALAGWDMFDVLREAERLGVGGVYIDAYHVGSLEPENLKRVREAAGGLALELGFVGTDLRTLRPWLEAAAALGSPNLRTFVSRDRYEPPVEEQVRTATANLRETIKCAEDLGVRVAIENHMELRSTELLQIAAKVASPNLGFCFDTGNSLAVLEEPLEAARNLAPLTFMVHLKDARITLEADHAKIHGVPLGEGIVPLREIASVLRQEAPECSVWLESLVVERASVEETCRAEVEAAEAGVGYAREELGLSDQETRPTGLPDQ